MAPQMLIFIINALTMLFRYYGSKLNNVIYKIINIVFKFLY